jgi:predicted TIM-barrel fold metal-dependent hydrolase
MISDINAYYGNWPTRPVDGAFDDVVKSLKEWGVERIFISPLHSAWCKNQQFYNDELISFTESWANVFPVPVLDPTLGSWREEFERMSEIPSVKIFKLFPCYAPYDASEALELFKLSADRGIPLILQARLEDIRCQHPLALVEDVDISGFLDIKKDLPDLKFVLGGCPSGIIHKYIEDIKSLDNIFVDTSQINGMDAVKLFCERGLEKNLLFGSHAPLFDTYSAFARIVPDLDEGQIQNIMNKNFGRLLANA